jgi:NTE family protein
MAGKKAAKQRMVNLALQGGGAHGAFEWGVLDALLEDGRIGIEGICATSVGSMNACALAYGMHTGGRDGAREMLHEFWWRMQQAGLMFNPVRPLPWQQAGSPWNMDNTPGYYLFDFITRTWSPHDLNPLHINPLRDIIGGLVDFEALHACDSIKLFISTTHVKTGRVRVFETPDVTLDVVMASACLPQIFEAVMIDGEPYWDGGYTGNPALFPLYYKTESSDILIVHLNPIERDETPVSAAEIMNRMNEISFNASLIESIRAIAFVKKLLEYDMLKEEYRRNFKNILVHSIRADQALKDLSLASKFSVDWGFLTYLRDSGREVMKKWLEENFDNIGTRSSVDLDTEFLAVNAQFEAYRRHSLHAGKDLGGKVMAEISRQKQDKKQQSE